MAHLAATIARRIHREGPLTVAAFMAMALHDPEAGYYARHNPLGAGGDFVTAPEISQIFGELIGLWCADFWLRNGRPDPVVVAELGPGSGALMRDFLRAAAGNRPVLGVLRVDARQLDPQRRRAVRCDAARQSRRHCDQRRSDNPQPHRAIPQVKSRDDSNATAAASREDCSGERRRLALSVRRPAPGGSRWPDPPGMALRSSLPDKGLPASRIRSPSRFRPAAGASPRAAHRAARRYAE